MTAATPYSRSCASSCGVADSSMLKSVSPGMTSEESMQQLLQSLATDVSFWRSPGAHPAPGAILMRTSRSLISSGTERMLWNSAVPTGSKRSAGSPRRHGRYSDKMRTDGVLATLEAVRSKLDQPIPLGYCNVGRVVETGAEAG